jgi:hypothetical protein
MVSVDFFAVPTVRFQILYAFLVLALGRRRIGHFALTAHPTAEWTVQQLREAFPWDAAPRYLLSDRDRIFGADFVDQVKAMGIQQVLSAPRSPWQRGLLVLLSLKRAQPNDILVCRLYATTEYLPQLVFSIGTDAPKPVQRRVALPGNCPINSRIAPCSSALHCASTQRKTNNFGRQAPNELPPE